MSKKEKLLSRFLSLPKDFYNDEMVKHLKYHGFEEVKKGKTSGSRVKFENQHGAPIMMHKLHPSGIMKAYQLKKVKELLGL